MLKEHDQTVLTTDIHEEGLKAGDVGTIVHVHRQGEAFEVEFLTLDGHTAAITTVPASHTRPVTDRDMSHAREIELPV